MTDNEAYEMYFFSRMPFAQRLGIFRRPDSKILWHNYFTSVLVMLSVGKRTQKSLAYENVRFRLLNGLAD